MIGPGQASSAWPRIGLTSIGEACSPRLRGEAPSQRTCSRPRPSISTARSARTAAARRDERAQLRRPRRARDRVAVRIQPVGDLLEARVQLVVAVERRRWTPGGPGTARASPRRPAAAPAADPAAPRPARRSRPAGGPAVDCARVAVGAGLAAEIAGQREQPLGRRVHAEELGRDVLDLVGLVEDHDLVGRQHLRLGPARAQRQVGEEQVVVDDHQRRGRRPAAHRRSRSSARRRRSAARCASPAWPRPRPTSDASSASSASSARSPVGRRLGEGEQPGQIRIFDQRAPAGRVRAGGAGRRSCSGPS